MISLHNSTVYVLNIHIFWYIPPCVTHLFMLVICVDQNGNANRSEMQINQPKLTPNQHKHKQKECIVKHRLKYYSVLFKLFRLTEKHLPQLSTALSNQSYFAFGDSITFLRHNIPVSNIQSIHMYMSSR